MSSCVHHSDSNMQRSRDMPVDISKKFQVVSIIIIIITKTLFNEGIHVIVTITLINLWPSTYILRTTKNCIEYMKYINI